MERGKKIVIPTLLFPFLSFTTFFIGNEIEKKLTTQNHFNMAYPELTITERVILANQYKILAHLEKDDIQLYRASILKNGYEVLYYEIFQGIEPTFPREAGREIHEILSMFRMIDNAKLKLTENQRSQVESLSFTGFDNHNESTEYSFLMFLIEESNRYQELKGRNLEPIGDKLPEYRRVYQAYLDSGMKARYENLSFEELMQLQEYIR